MIPDADTTDALYDIDGTGEIVRSDSHYTVYLNDELTPDSMAKLIAVSAEAGYTAENGRPSHGHIAAGIQFTPEEEE